MRLVIDKAAYIRSIVADSACGLRVSVLLPIYRPLHPLESGNFSVILPTESAESDPSRRGRRERQSESRDSDWLGTALGHLVTDAGEALGESNLRLSGLTVPGTPGFGGIGGGTLAVDQRLSSWHTTGSVFTARQKRLPLDGSFQSGN